MSLRLRTAGNVAELVHEHAQAVGDREAVVFVRDPSEDQAAEALTYAQLDRDARRLAAMLGGSLNPGERVLLPLTSGLSFARGFLGCLYAGVVVVPAPPPNTGVHSGQRLAAVARDADAAAVVTDPAGLPAVSAWADAEGLDRLQCLAADGGAQGDPDAWTMPRVSRESLALLQYTSGSTTEPKGVMVTHGNLLHNADAVHRAMGRPHPVHFGGWGPLFHDMGLAVLLNPLLLGGSAVLMAPTTFLKRPHAWLQLIDRYDVGFSPAPNFAYDLCVRQVTDEQLAGLDLSRWDHALNGAEPVDAGTLDRFARRFAPAGFRRAALCPVYGLAEATVYVSGISPSQPTTRRVDTRLLEHGELVPVGSDDGRDLVGCGVPDGFDVRIVDPDTNEVLPDGRVGEIWLRGPSVAAGYWRQPDATARSFRAVTADRDAGFLRTGDLGVRHESELFVTTRIKDLIIIHGRNLHPQDLEHEARLHHEELGSVGVAFAIGAAEQKIIIVHEVRGIPGRQRLAELAAGIKQAIAREFGVSVAGVVLMRKGTILRTTSGKVRRSAMRELFLADALDPFHELLDPTVRPDDLRTWLARRIAHHLDRAPEQIDPDATLDALGLDSVRAFVVCGEIEDHLDIRVTETLVWDYPTVNAIVGYLNNALSAGQATR